MKTIKSIAAYGLIMIAFFALLKCVDVPDTIGVVDFLCHCLKCLGTAIGSIYMSYILDKGEEEI